MESLPATVWAIPIATPIVTWTNVAVAAALILLDISISLVFKLGVARSLIIAAIRCVVQLSLMGFVLESVFKSQSPWAVAGMSFAMLVLGSNEVTFTRSKRRPQGLFLSSLISLLCSVIPVTTIGTRFGIVRDPFWAPQSFIPVLGMIAGNAISGMAVATTYVVRELVDNRDKVETYLAHGASRTEAVLPVAREALLLALLPTINQMSILGLISLPGLMTGAILGGQSVEQAAKMQMIIMFLITATTTLCVSISLLLSLSVLVDSSHRIRLDRVESGGSPFELVKLGMLWVWHSLRGCLGRKRGAVALEGEE